MYIYVDIYTNPIKIPHGICKMITVNSSIFFQQLGSEAIFPAANLLFLSLSDAIGIGKKLPEMTSQILEQIMYVKLPLRPRVATQQVPSKSSYSTECLLEPLHASIEAEPEEVQNCMARRDG